MRLAKIIGHADSITKTDDLYGAELLIAVPVDMETMDGTGTPFLIADKLGARYGQMVVYAVTTPYEQDSVVMETVVAIPEALQIDGEERFRQIVEEQQAVFEEAAEPTEAMEQQNGGDVFEDFDPVSDLTAEFQALHREIDELPSEKEDAFKSTTNTVPYEQYAKYLTTDFEPIEEKTSVTSEDKQRYSRVGYRSGRSR